jgi:hypothetical protein
MIVPYSNNEFLTMDQRQMTGNVGAGIPVYMAFTGITL